MYPLSEIALTAFVKQALELCYGMDAIYCQGRFALVDKEVLLNAVSLLILASPCF